MNLLKPIVALVVLLFFVSVNAFAQNNTHTVEEGETLFSIAQEYNIGVEQLKSWNNITDNGLSVGQSLVVQAPEQNPQDGKTHTVEKQETLFSISKMYNVSIAEIKSWNNLSTNNLSVGQSLTIYPSEAKKSGPQSIVIEEETQQNTYYTVKSGDSLYRIAEQHNMTVDELKKLNGLTTNTIRIGQRLTVKSQSGESPPSVAAAENSSPQGKFISYAISGGSESLSNILQKFQMSETEFRALNSGIEGSSIASGQTVTVLAPPTKQYGNPYLSSSNMQSLGNTSVTQYGESEKASPTTNGELYNPNALTAAHSNISLGTVIYIENPENSKGAYVRINDRNSGNGLKLSSAAWQVLNFRSNSPTVMIYQN
jgi:LysM repeat protein